MVEMEGYIDHCVAKEVALRSEGHCTGRRRAKRGSNPIWQPPAKGHYWPSMHPLRRKPFSLLPFRQAYGTLHRVLHSAKHRPFIVGS